MLLLKKHHLLNRLPKLLRNKILITCLIKLAGYFFKNGGNMLKRTLIILLMFSVLIVFVGCNETKVEENLSGEVIIKMPTDNTINGYRKPSISGGNIISSKTQTSVPLMYYANTSSKKFHKNTCRYASSTDNSKLYITENRNELILQGYSPCKICEP